MEIPEIYILIVSIIFSIFSIASNAIGIESFNNNSDWKTNHMSHFAFLIINLIVSILILILSITGLVLRLNN